MTFCAVRAALCERWWRRPFKKIPLLGTRVDILPSPGVVDSRLRDLEQNDSFDQFLKAYELARNQGASIIGAPPEKPDLPFRVGVTEINERRQMWKDILLKAGPLSDVKIFGAPFTSRRAYIKAISIGNEAFPTYSIEYGPFENVDEDVLRVVDGYGGGGYDGVDAYRRDISINLGPYGSVIEFHVFSLPESVAGIYSGLNPVRSLPSLYTRTDPYIRHAQSFVKGLTEFFPSYQYYTPCCYPIPIGNIIGGDKDKGYIDIAHQYMFNINLDMLTFPLSAEQAPFFNLYLPGFLGNPHPKIPYTSAEKLGPVWRFYIGATITEYLLKNKLGVIMFGGFDNSCLTAAFTQAHLVAGYYVGRNEVLAEKVQSGKDWIERHVFALNDFSNTDYILLDGTHQYSSLPTYNPLASCRGRWPLLPRQPVAGATDTLATHVRSAAHALIQSGILDPVPETSFEASDSALPTEAEALPPVPSLLTTIDQALFYSLPDYYGITLDGFEVYGRDGYIYLVDQKQSLHDMQITEDGVIFAFKRALPDGEYVPYSMSAQVGSSNNFLPENSETTTQHQVQVTVRPFTWSPSSLVYTDWSTGPDYDKEVVFGFVSGTVSFYYAEYDCACYWVNGIRPLYEDQQGQTPPADYCQASTVSPFLIGYPDGTIAFDTAKLTCVSTKEPQKRYWAPQEAPGETAVWYNLFTYQNAFLGHTIRSDIPCFYFSPVIAFPRTHPFTSSPVSPFWLRSPFSRLGMLSQDYLDVPSGADLAIGDNRACEVCAFIIKSKGRSKIGTLTGSALCLFNMDPSVGTVTREGSDYFYTPLKQGIDWLFYIDGKNYIPCSTAVVVVDKMLPPGTNGNLYATIEPAYTYRCSRGTRFRMDIGFLRTQSSYAYSYERTGDHPYYSFTADTSAPEEITYSQATGYSGSNRHVLYTCNKVPPYRLKAYLGWKVNVGGETELYPVHYSILSGIEFESFEDGHFDLDFTTTLYGLPKENATLLVFIVDPILGNWITRPLPSLLAPQVMFGSPSAPSQSSSNPASNNPVVLP